MATQPSSMPASAGVEALIARLRDEGVAAGRSEADRIIDAAKDKARAIVAKAEAEAEALTKQARSEAESYRRAAEDALKSAARDAVLQLKERLVRRFADEIAGAVSKAMVDETLLQKLIVALVGRARDDAQIDRSGDVEIVLPREAIAIDSLRRRPESVDKDPLTAFVAARTGDMLREGIRFSRADDTEGGIRIVMHDSGISVDLTDRAVAGALLVHLQPRFRALLEGVVS
ncbi:hypothetical protein LB518_01165 [Mesorhizobium sp. BR1-1-16]|uniref:V-type ATP synthase subunit E family protein n=1 Tax=Mesorhizobium sp. BR1-1-16 TaxID=2876653 RepID=UPI001CCBCF8C|nr:V-type ATP synthase subunit E family protein [Mesorhizobium sp. BR1-1-16]MBZ9934889.1 hypothetical protein [Mesorhizobium sp. BR1-1-16]